MKSIKMFSTIWLLLTSIACFGDPPNQTNWWSTYKQDLLSRLALLQTNNVSMSNTIEIISLSLTNGLRANPQRGVPEPDLRALRELETKIILSCMVRLDKALDKSWDPKDVPQLNVAPPRGVPLPSGVSPSEIKDAALRSEYESAIASNDAKAKKYEAQRKLRDVITPVLEKARYHVSLAYTRGDHKELERLFGECQVDAEMRSAILRGVKDKRNPNTLR